ncbi:flagellar basal-body MS-ring/collar protein FliF [Photobacterium halotolerans]|uniref:Flagellar M-ring protein n=1 Tax=Photobacterium halotolerans TaxID=265726 RepID=A0A7X5B0D8_9GAMM|nr:flagellar basal-body MS-ring/collar protein FliF [Photobacterium halotolerans]NAW64988.1 flagellar M-ring protein FliF [Photobacterium halotolerans]NAW85821.1 flagellar M-ring protein FliF [Photobacterium halotolerans]
MTMITQAAAAELTAANRSDHSLLERAKLAWYSSQRNLVLSAALAAVVAAIIVVALWTSTQSYRPLYSQQERFDTSEIISVLEAEGIPYRLQETNGQVLVEDGRVAEVRMLLAAKGVKAKLPTGLETLQTDSALGTSQFMETARYRHGLEGELARTIISLNAVNNARVHLAIPRQTLFVRQNTEKTTASVMVELKPGEDLKPEQVEAIVNLVSGSVTGMTADHVSVVDQFGRLLSADIGSETSGRMNTKYLEYQKNLEKQVIQRASDMLTPVLGPSNFRVQVAADLDFSRIEETREMVDDNPVVRSEHSIENNSTDKIALGVPGSLSNQPPTVEEEGEEEAPKNTSERSEVNRQYALGSSVRHTQYQQGQIKKLNVSVLLNNAVAPDGTAWDEAQKAEISQMISEAVGLNAERGDSLSLMSFNFTPVNIEPVAPMPWWQDTALQQPLRYIIGGLLGLAMIFFVLRPLIRHLTGVDKARQEMDIATLPDNILSKELDEQAQENELNRRLSDRGLSNTTNGLDADAEMMLPPSGSPLHIQLKHLTLIASEEPQRVAEVLKQWVNGNEHNRDN